jgi:hypothetical protein
MFEFVNPEFLSEEVAGVVSNFLPPSGRFWWVKDNTLLSAAPCEDRVRVHCQDTELDLHRCAKELNELSKFYLKGEGPYSFNCPVDREHVIDMIKDLRHRFGSGLKESKEYVEMVISNRSPYKKPFLSFTLYAGIADLEGYGYFPMHPTVPVPVEAARLFGYIIAKEKQQVVAPSYWGIKFSSYNSTYFVVPNWSTGCPLVWDPTCSQVKEWDGSLNVVEDCFFSHKEAVTTCSYMNEAYRHGMRSIVYRLQEIIDNHDI